MSNNNAQFYVGQLVWDRTLSETSGIVTATDNTSTMNYPVVVDFGVDRYTYTTDGRIDSDRKFATLRPYYYDIVEVEILPEVGTVVYAWDDLAQDDEREHPNVLVGFFMGKGGTKYRVTQYASTVGREHPTYSHISTERPNWI